MINNLSDLLAWANVGSAYELATDLYDQWPCGPSIILIAKDWKLYSGERAAVVPYSDNGKGDPVERSAITWDTVASYADELVAFEIGTIVEGSEAEQYRKFKFGTCDGEDLDAYMQDLEEWAEKEFAKVNSDLIEME